MPEVSVLPKLVIFDLDGTLVDSVPDIAVALNRALRDLGQAPVAEDAVRRWVGNGARMLCGRALSGSMRDTAAPEHAEKLLDAFLERYAERVCVESRLYPGAREILQWLRTKGCALACVTNKPVRHTRELLRALELDGCFGLVLGGDSLPKKKPDPLPLQECLRHFAVSVQESLVVGDSENDIAAARAAGIASICVTYGYSQDADVRELGADWVIETLPAITALFELPENA